MRAGSISRFGFARTAAWTSLFAIASSACAGGTPLLHPAEVLRPGQVAFGAGLSGEFKALKQKPDAENPRIDEFYDDLAVAPGVAPYVAGRVGIDRGFEAGLTYTARAMRVDGRKAFSIKPLTLSLGLGASALFPKEIGEDAGSVYGGGGDIPLLFGWSSSADLYSVWFGPRLGFEVLSGHVLESAINPNAFPDADHPITAYHFSSGGVVGFRVGFRYFHAALELDVDYHNAWSGLIHVENVSITPAGAMILSL